MSDLKQIEPGDLIDVDAKLRAVMDVLEDGAFVLEARFDHLGKEIESEAVKMRQTLSLGASRIYQLIRLIEAHPTYLALKREREDEDE